MTEHTHDIEFEGEYPKVAYHPHKAIPEYLEYFEKAADSLKTVRLVVFAGLTTFVVLAIYGYFLIYQLTKNADDMAITMQRMANTMQLMERDIHPMSETMAQMNQSMYRMAMSARNMDSSISPPMRAMNSFMPWGNEPRIQQPPSAYLPPPQPRR